MKALGPVLAAASFLWSVPLANAAGNFDADGGPKGQSLSEIYRNGGSAMPAIAWTTFSVGVQTAPNPDGPPDTKDGHFESALARFDWDFRNSWLFENEFSGSCAVFSAYLERDSSWFKELHVPRTCWKVIADGLK